jgi:putative transposase
MRDNQPLECGKYYHIYNRGINSAPLFKEQANYEYFLRLYDSHINPMAETFAWCLMNNHFHFLVRIKDEAQNTSSNKIPPSKSFSNLFNAYTKGFNKSNNRHGPLFERPFRRKEITNEQYFQNAILYIHNNPVHHKMCEHPIQYPWSSYLTCITEIPIKIERTKVLSYFDDLENFKYLHQQNKHTLDNEPLLGEG